jgi:hypothetical protein
MIHCHLRNEYFATFDDDRKTIDKPGKRGHIKLHKEQH